MDNAAMNIYVETQASPPPPIVSDHPSPWSTIARLAGHLGFFATTNFYFIESLKFIILGSLTASLIETIRRLWQWLIGRFRFQYAISARFDEGDPAYEWIILLLTQENVWEASRNFHITHKSSARKWGVKTGPHAKRNAEYIPTYEESQLFRWKGCWVKVDKAPIIAMESQYKRPNSLVLRMFTFKMSDLSDLVEDARQRYIEVNRPNVSIHLADTPSYGLWTNVKRKFKRPLGSIILEDGMVDSLLEDARDFLDSEDRYTESGIPHRRGYLLYGPPGTGKTSTIYALAGELGLEIYSLSLSSGQVDDMFLQRAASCVPKSSIFLLEDIDCAFPTREDEDDVITRSNPYTTPYRRASTITLSGLLNVIDGVGSEEGKLFFATTNYVDRLDPALLRPGRIDVKVQYKLSTKEQAKALYSRFFPESRFGALAFPSIQCAADTTKLAGQFAALIPEEEFSTASLQGYLLTCRKDPAEAVAGVTAWVEKERTQKREREEREFKRREKLLAQGMPWTNNGVRSVPYYTIPYPTALPTDKSNMPNDSSAEVTTTASL